MIGDFTKEQKEAVLNFIHAGNEVEAAIARENFRYKELLRVMGEKAYCHCCGNQHWPLCDEDEYDDTDYMP